MFMYNHMHTDRLWGYVGHSLYKILAVSAARGASPQRHVYVRYMYMFVIIYICPTKQYDYLMFCI
jgi:hypothetical protein